MASSANIKRILKELQSFENVPNNFTIKVFPTADEITQWKVLLIGPKGSSYNYGIYQLLINFS